jgi:IS605 OrfB family transposase
MPKFTQIMEIVDCSDLEQLRSILKVCGTVRALTYNKLGSLQGWGLNWKGAEPMIRKILHPKELGIPSKIFEWTVSDTFKAINAQQEAAKTFLIKKIYQKYSSPTERKEICQLLNNNPTGNNWLHRHFRNQYIKGHSYIKNQIVYQKQGYKATRISRYLIQLEVQGLVKGKRIKLLLKTNRLPKGQIRIIEEKGKLYLHTAFSREIPIWASATEEIGMDKGYTEGFYLSTGEVVAPNLGELLTKKTERINQENKNRNRLYHHAKKQKNKEKREHIYNCNLGKKVKNKKLQRDKAEIKGMIRYGLKQVLKKPFIIYAEDLSSPIKNKTQSKRINRRLNSWVKGELQVSLEEIGTLTGSTVKTVNAAYTSQVDHQTGTLLGSRNGDCFTRYTGEVLQSDYNASCVILSRGTDSEISRYMKYQKVREVLLHRTVRYLHSHGYRVNVALDSCWLLPKFKKEALTIESEYLRKGYRERLSTKEGECVQLELPLF